MRKADTGKVKVVRDDALIVAVDIGMEMNRGYCTTPDGRSTKTFNPSSAVIKFGRCNIK